MTNAGKVYHESLILFLSRRIDETLAPLVERGAEVALLEYPDYSNVGDSAIWLGETEWLSRHDSRVVYSCDLWTYSPEKLRARLGGGTILLQGGGNLGDFWVEHQRFRERVIEDFPDNRIIQLPQTIYFMDEWGVGEARRIFNAHPDFTLLCRDQSSLDFARREFSVNSALCPDMAFALGKLKRPSGAVTDIVWLGRSDAESPGSELPPLRAGIEFVDWLDEPPSPVRERNEDLRREIESDPQDWPALLDSLMETYDPLARERLERGCRVLSRGKVVITDRLHAHILCLLLGIPHVVLDNNYGKVRGFYDAWTGGSDFVHWATTPAEALEMAERIVGEEAVR